MPEHDHSDEDVSLFRDRMRDVAPLAETGRIEPNVVLPARRISLRSKEAVLLKPDGLSDSMASLQGGYDPETGVFVRSGLKKEVLRRLRRGYWGVQAELDLHGLTRDAARTSLVRFLEYCGHRHIRCVRIVHGKGINSPEGLGVLRQLLPTWLAQRDAVLAFCPALPSDGGAGAVVVLLKLV